MRIRRFLAGHWKARHLLTESRKARSPLPNNVNPTTGATACDHNENAREKRRDADRNVADALADPQVIPHRGRDIQRSLSEQPESQDCQDNPKKLVVAPVPGSGV